MVIARGTPGFSGADLANLVNEAALLAARRGKRQVSMSEFESAKDKVLMGIERRSMVMSDEEKRLTAYHEAGHAIAALNMKDSDPIHKATIIPRGRALGMVMRLPESDRISVSRDKLEADLCVAMGGRIAEELVFGYGKVTTGASSDIKQATDIVKKMIIEWGMGKLGFLSYAKSSQDVFLGHSVMNPWQMSEATAQAIDREVRELVDRLYKKTYDLLSGNMEQLHVIAKGLIDYETLSGDEIKALLRGEAINRSIATDHEEGKAKDNDKRLDFPTSNKTHKKKSVKQSKTSTLPSKRKTDNKSRSVKPRSSKQEQ
jgi:cell division protease FtsH